MSQDYVDDCYASDHVVQTDMANIEKNFAALKSFFSGATAPSNLVAGMPWFDTTTNILKLRNEANNGWQSIWDFANNKPVVTNNISADFGAALKDPAAGTAGLRTLGTGAQQAVPGNRGLHDGSVTNVKIADTVAGSIQDIIAQEVEYCHNATIYTKVTEIKIAFGGAFRYKFHLRRYSQEGTAYGRVYKNGVAFGNQHSNTSSAGVWYEANLSGCSAGDLIQIYSKQSSGSGQVCVKDFSLSITAPMHSVVTLSS